MTIKITPEIKSALAEYVEAAKVSAAAWDAAYEAKAVGWRRKPKDMDGEGMKLATAVGQTRRRFEVAKYALDKRLGIADLTP